MYNLREEIAGATKAYYDQAHGIPLSALDFFDWLTNLSAARRTTILAQGFARSPAQFTWLRFCLEKRGFRMWTFMEEHMSRDAFLLWADHE